MWPQRCWPCWEVASASNALNAAIPRSVSTSWKCARRRRLAGPFSDEILQVSTLRISPRYQDRSFVYRISDSGFEADFYNQFVAPPAGLISEEIRKSLIGAELFKYVISASNSQAPSYVLEGAVNGIYGDFRNLNAPAAIIDLEFFLTSDLPAKPGILLQKRYVKSVPVSSRSPEALVKSWDLALEEILTALIAGS